MTRRLALIAVFASVTSMAGGCRGADETAGPVDLVDPAAGEWLVGVHARQATQRPT